MDYCKAMARQRRLAQLEDQRGGARTGNTTTSQRDERTRGLRNDKTTRDNATTSWRDEETTRGRHDKTTRQREGGALRGEATHSRRDKRTRGRRKERPRVIEAIDQDYRRLRYTRVGPYSTSRGRTHRSTDSRYRLLRHWTDCSSGSHAVWIQTMGA